MTEQSSILRVVRGARRDAAPALHDDGASLHVQIAAPGAKVLLLPGRFRGQRYVADNVRYILSRGAEEGERHIRRNLNAIRRTLVEMGVDQIAIDVEVRRVETEVRVELWRQVLTPDDRS
ncbi:hypothetical protein GPL21_33370 [Bradyrhizobium pachyrhizi]|uniref:Uncharacterized protein n=1 Tax=Bradyrhizobium pachyrhizi TaxID=280333 RepID=A0A844SVF0_9BRAD|nr:DUF6074 family protein [Bradyrhizobium pachyrhizi]MVT69976.1 hypothetical protein [Bradyrhizobium pachyrhizi]